MIGDINVRKRVERLEIGDNIDSDHQPLVVWIRMQEKEWNKRERRDRWKSRWVWSEKGKEEFRQKLKEIETAEVRMEKM